MFLFFLTGTWGTADRTEVTNTELMQLTLMDLHPAKAYNIRMFAANSVGLSDSSNILTVTTKEEGTVTHCLTFHREFYSFLLDGLLYEFFLSSAPVGPPLDVQVAALTSSSIRIIWKVDSLC